MRINYYFLSNVQTESGPPFQGKKRPECETQHSLPPRAKVKLCGAIPPFQHMSSRHDP